MNAIIELENTTPEILAKIKEYIASFGSVQSKIETLANPYELSEEDLQHIQKGREDAKNGRVTSSEDVMKQMRALCQEK